MADGLIHGEGEADGDVGEVVGWDIRDLSKGQVAQKKDNNPHMCDWSGMGVKLVGRTPQAKQGTGTVHKCGVTFELLGLHSRIGIEDHEM